MHLEDRPATPHPVSWPFVHLNLRQAFELYAMVKALLVEYLYMVCDQFKPSFEKIYILTIPSWYRTTP